MTDGSGEATLCGGDLVAYVLSRQVSIFDGYSEITPGLILSSMVLLREVHAVGSLEVMRTGDQAEYLTHCTFSGIVSFITLRSGSALPGWAQHRHIPRSLGARTSGGNWT